MCFDFPDLANIFDEFLPQLLRYPNPLDPMNSQAASLLLHDRESYDAKVKGNPATPSFAFVFLGSWG